MTATLCFLILLLAGALSATPNIAVFPTHSVFEFYNRKIVVTEHEVFAAPSHTPSHDIHHLRAFYLSGSASDNHGEFLDEFLPNPGYTEFNSTKGQQMLARHLMNESQIPFLSMFMQFQTQVTQTTCSLASMSNVVNALPGVELPIDPDYKPYPFMTQRSIYKNTNLQQKAACAKDVVAYYDILHRGATLAELSKVLQCYVPSDVFDIEVVHAADSNMQQWRKHLAKLKTGRSIIIVNFSRVHLKEMGGGHFSVLSMLDDATDTALLMDVARYKYPFYYVPSDRMFQAMNTTDTQSEKSRGWMLVTIPK